MMAFLDYKTASVKKSQLVTWIHTLCCRAFWKPNITHVAHALSTLAHVTPKPCQPIQEALWESEFQAQEWQQQLCLQRVRARPSLQRFGPSRSISLPSTSQQYQSQLTRAKTGTNSHASSYTKQSNAPLPATMQSPLPAVSKNGSQSNQQCQPVPLIPLIKVPSSTSEAYAHSAASAVAVANSDRSGTCAASLSDASPAQPRASFCSNVKPARRRASDLGLPASKACQRLKKASPGKGHTTSLHHPAVCSNSHTSKSKQQPEVVITAGMKAGPVAFATGLSAGGKGKASGDVRPLSQGVGGKPAQVSPSPRYITLDDLLISQ